MIYTVTFNPSLDYTIEVKDFSVGITNRTTFESMMPGGKGLNVSTVLQNLGYENTALGFLAGFTGEEIKKLVEKAGIQSEFIWIEEGISRINVKLRSIEGTEINGNGPVIGTKAIDQLMQRLDQLRKGDTLILAGSIPSSMPDDIYEKILERIQGKEICTIVDATKDLLLKVLKYHPFLIKPNLAELGEIFHVALKNGKEAIPYGRKIQEMGAENVLISMAGDGAILIGKDGKVYEAPAPEGTLINGVGAGDSMVAGFLAGWLQTRDIREAFLLGVAAGSASAYSEHLASKEDIWKLYKIVKESTGII